ncbi:peptidase [Flavobacterium sp.]|jgi:hypothetical protein|uniref:peptidase n=1 Tax=Flavobacterium sp. TaxID=239 RepID=UPI0037BF1BC8
MSDNRLKKEQLKKQLFTKNRLVILNEDTFEEIFSLKLTLMNVFVVASIGAILIITVTTFIIAFTPLREYIPGYTSTKLKKDATELALKSDSLEFAIKKNEIYLQSIQKVLNGNLQYAKVNKDSILALSVDTLPDLQLTATESELKLRKEVTDEENKAKEKSKPSKPKK